MNCPMLLVLLLVLFGEASGSLLFIGRVLVLCAFCCLVWELLESLSVVVVLLTVFRLVLLLVLVLVLLVVGSRSRLKASLSPMFMGGVVVLFSLCRLV